MHINVFQKLIFLNTCSAQLEIKSDDEITVLKPKGKLKLIITGDPGATVGLVAVDKGVYVLNNKHRLTQSKVPTFCPYSLLSV